VKRRQNAGVIFENGLCGLRRQRRVLRPEAVHAASFAGARVAFGGGAVEDAFEFGFDVFSGGCVAYGVSISIFLMRRLWGAAVLKDAAMPVASLRGSMV
jgi:hypothetical protein